MRVRRDHLAGEHDIERRQADRPIGDHLGRGAAMSEQKDGAERAVVADAGEQLERIRAFHHLFDGKAGDPGEGGALADHLQHLVGSLLDARAGAQVEADAADIGLVRDVGRQDLDDHRAAHLLRDAAGLGRVGGGAMTWTVGMP